MFITVEGLDGAGKNTLTLALAKTWRERGLTVAELGFPRYGRSIHADIAAESLKGIHDERLANDPLSMALLFALDRFGAKKELESLIESNDVVLCDRYVASNAAYSAARLEEDALGPMVQWVHNFEFDRLGLPRPDCQILLATTPELARQRTQQRATQDFSRERDTYERDEGLQQRVGQVYAHLAAIQWAGAWRIIEATKNPQELARELLITTQ